MNKALITAKNIYKTYGTKVKNDVLKDVNFSLEENSFNWIIGASGSGKTTLLNIISGLDEASKGEVYINNTLITNMSENEKATFRSKHLGFVFQFHYLLPEFNALENILMPLRIQKIKITKKVKQEALELMNSIGILHIKNHYPKQMSGGEQQRVAIARAIISKPKLIIADEPTGNLDSESAAAVYDTIRNLHNEHNITFVIVTHAKITPNKGDRLIRLKDGMIVEDIKY